MKKGVALRRRPELVKTHKAFSLFINRQPGTKSVPQKIEFPIGKLRLSARALKWVRHTTGLQME
jgi:hypothetical protein